MARISMREPCGSGWKRRVGTCIERQAHAPHRRLGVGHLLAPTSSRNPCSRSSSRSEKVIAASSSISVSRLRLVAARRAGSSASASRRLMLLCSVFRCPPRRLAASCRSSSPAASGCARRCERPDRKLLLVVPVDENGVQRPIEIAPARRCPTARTASSASSTLPGPIGNPAARSARAKYMMLAKGRPPSGAVAEPSMQPLAASSAFTWAEQALGFAALDLGDVVLVFEQHAERIVDRFRRQRQHIELRQRMRPSRWSRRCPAA